MDEARTFRDKVAVVVGGASGMGNAVVRMLVQEGCRTHVLDIRETTDGLFQFCDVRDYDQVQRSVDGVVKQEGRIDLLFVAAGVHLFADIEETSIEEFEDVLSVNLKGPFYVLKNVLPLMRKQRYGNVVLMGSDQVFIGKGSSSVYGLSKAQPIQRLGTPEEIGKAVLFLLSDDCPFMTGALISADGGYTCQ